MTWDMILSLAYCVCAPLAISVLLARAYRR